MNSNKNLNLGIPLLYVNPTINRDSRLIEAVSETGGLGFLDLTSSDGPGFEVPQGVSHGVRVGLDELDACGKGGDIVAALIPLRDADRLANLEPDFLKSFPVPVVVEVGSTAQVHIAERAGAAALVARGNEGPGWVSETSGFVLLQAALEDCGVPVFLQGGVGPRSAAGAIATGAAGVVLDVQLLFTVESAVEPALKDFLLSLGIPTTVTLGDSCGAPCRVYSRVGTKKAKELRSVEDSLTEEEAPGFLDSVETALRAPFVSLDRDEALLGLSEDIVAAKRLAEEFQSSKAVLAEFSRSMCECSTKWPFGKDSQVAGKHGTEYPVVQGPMAHVSDSADFLAEVKRGGALPFLAMGNMPAGIAREGIQIARDKTDGNFGVGLIGLEVNRHCYEAHIDIMREDPPPYAILAAGSPELAKSIEKLGTVCYLHCPAPAVVTEALKAGLRNFVFEGHESGGHIGSLGSLDLWSANLRELEVASRNGLDLAEVTVLFAGGIGSGRASAFIAGMIGDLVEKGLNAGLQMGTAYLATEEAVSSCAITKTYQQLTIDSDSTVVIGRTVNTRARAAGSPMAARLIEREYERIRDGVPLRERKGLYEKDNLGALRLAAKGCAIDPNTATWDCPVFCDLAPEDQLDRGLYLMGQAVALLDSSTTIARLHEEVTLGGQKIFESPRISAESAAVETVALEEYEASPVEESVHQDEPIAIVGMGLRLPGSNSPNSYWDQILSGRSGIIEAPESRWGNLSFYYDPDPKAPDKTYSKIGGFIEDFSFDPIQYRIPPSVAKQMDRTQQMAVTSVADALTDAGLTPADLKGRKVGIVLGNSMGGETTDLYAARVGLPRTLSALEKSFDEAGLDRDAARSVIDRFRESYLEGLPVITEDSLPGELANVISGRVANVFNLEGPNFTVDAACASSIAAVMNAMSALRDGTIDFAITGGVDAAMHPSSFVKFCKIGALSPDGSRPFDEGANGFVMGEGCGVMVLKRLSDAVRDNDRIYATIVAIGSSSDGRGKGITAPNAAGQERAIKACLENNSIPAESLRLIEAHGTSTAVGDKTELMVLDRYFRDLGAPAASVGLGSVKSQIGHLKAAAGAAGILKTALALFSRTLPPTTNVKTPNPCIDWESSPLYLVTETKPWPASDGFPRRAGVSAFGFGGTNFHICLQEHIPGLRVITGKKKEIAPAPIEFIPPDWPIPPELKIAGEAWVIGANELSELPSKIETLRRELSDGNASQIASRCRDAARSGKVRCGFAAKDAQEAEVKLTAISEGLVDPKKLPFLKARGIHFSDGSARRDKPGVAFLFPGQGSQYPFMMRDLAERYPVVAETFREADEILESLGLPGVTKSVFPDMRQLAEEGEKAAGKIADAMKDTQLLQPMILTANAAMFRLLDRMGVRPAACAGHSLGEYAACVAAGVFSFRDALEAVAVRGREMARVSIADPGLMMSVPADARVVEDVLNQVDGYVVAANKNSPKQTVISGETKAVEAAAELFKANGLDGVLLPVSAAFHSGVVAPAREPFMKTLKRLAVNGPSVPVISNVTGDYYPVGPAASERITDLLGKQFAAPVEWVKTLRKLYSDGIRIFLECGPKRVMTNLSLDTLPDDILAAPSNHPKKGGVSQLMETLAALVVEGVEVDFAAAERPTAQVERHTRPELTVVRTEPTPAQRIVERTVHKPGHLDALLDSDIADMAAQPEFSRYLELQGDPIRSLIKSGFKTYLDNILPMEKTVRQVEAQGMDFKPVVISGISAGLPSDARFPFDRENLDDLILGKNFIRKVPRDNLRDMVEKNIERLYKGPAGEAELRAVEDASGVIKLAGYFDETEISDEYGIDKHIASSMDVTTRLALAAGIEALRDAGIPLVRQTRVTSTGHTLPDSWALPEPLRAETGVIFASAFPGISSLVQELSREAVGRFGAGARKRLIDFYSGLIGRIRDNKEREGITKWFTEEFGQLSAEEPDEVYTFNRSFLLKVMSLGSGQLAQHIRAMGPNTHSDAACASTTQAVLMARDWIRTGQAKRVLVVAADDVAGSTLLPWIGSGFLAMGAATTEGNVTDAALPFDDRRAGLILGSAAAGFVVEKQDLVEARGMEAIAAVEGGMVANSAFHGTRLSVDHIAKVMGQAIGSWEEQSGKSRDELAEQVFFMSHETYSPKRGGSSAAEIAALRAAFGEKAREIPIANTKGFTGHTMGVGVEDAVALRCLQKGLLPPIPNLKQPDPDFADMNLSRGGSCDAKYALRLAAGFGSQIVVSIYRAISREENRITDLTQHREWLRDVTGYKDPVVSVEQRCLRAAERVVDDDRQLEESPADKTIALARVSTTETIAQAAGQGEGPDQVREKILALLADKTGYPADMLDTGLDLEADLGIDTVKQAEFITEVREAFGIPRIEGLKIADFPTIERIIEFVLEHTRVASGDAAATTGQSEGSAAGGTAEQEEEIAQKVLALLADKTGYPADMLDTDLDLEADLGIDTVKQAEFITEIREMFGIPRIDGLKIADFPTIRHIIGFVMERTAAVSPSPAVAPADSASQGEALTAGEPQADIRSFEAVLVDLPALTPIDPPQAERVFVVGGADSLASQVEGALTALGYREVTRVNELPADVDQSPATGVVNLHAYSPDKESLKRTFELFLATAKAFEQGPAFYVTVVSEDGALGFSDPQEHGRFAGAALGATKSFAREYPDCLVRAMDIHPSLSPEKTAAAIAQALSHEFPSETGVAEDGTLKVVRFVPTMDERPESPIGSDDVILVSGGARGITAQCLLGLADQGTPTLVLLGRTPLTNQSERLAGLSDDEWAEEKTKIIERMKRQGIPVTPVKVDRELSRMRSEAEVAQTVRALRNKGAEVIYRGVDIRDADAVHKALEETMDLCGRVDVVTHAAGIDSSRALRNKTLEEIERVVSVKLDGMSNILNSLEKLQAPPRRIVGFGSVSGRFGNLAQIDYSAANDGLAHMLRWADAKLDAKVSVIDWAPWAEIGMAAAGSVQKTLEEAGIDFITPEVGVKHFVDELARSSGSPEVMVAGALGPFSEDAFHTAATTERRQVILAGQKARVIEELPGHYLKAAVTLDPSHPLLDHHRIDRAAVLPGVGGMEIMAAAANLLVPDASSMHYEDVAFRSPLKIFKDEPFEAEVEVARVDRDGGEPEFKAKIVSWFRDKEGKKTGLPRLHHECRILIDEAPKPDEVDDKTWPQSIVVLDHDIYSVFFHGPGFQFLGHVDVEGGGKGVRFGFSDSDERGAMFRDAIPAAVEAVFQAAAAFGVEARGFMALPTGAGRVTVHDREAMPVSGALTLVREDKGVAIEGRSALVFDGFLLDADRRPIVTLSGVEMVELATSDGFPGKIFEETAEVAEIERKAQTDGDFLKRILSIDEESEYSQKKIPKRAREWITGRVAMKGAVRRMIMATEGAEISENKIRVVPDSQGKPTVELPQRAGAEACRVSLSHSNGLAIAASASPKSLQAIGVDIEKVEERSRSWAEDYFSESEITLASGQKEQSRALTSMWALKEALLKAIGAGLRFDLREIKVDSIKPDGKAALAFSGEAARYLEQQALSHEAIDARVENRNGLAMARVVVKK